MSSLARRLALVAVVVVGALALSARDVGAHTFLVRSSPEPGARLRAPPDEIVLDFTEPVTAQSSIKIHDADERVVDLLSVALDADSTRLQASLPRLGDGVYRVSWRVVADDDHITEGEFVFGVGVAVPTGARATGQAGDGRVMWPDWLAGLALLAGVAVAFGGLLSERFIWKDDPPNGRASIVTGALVLGLFGAIATVLLHLNRERVVGQPSRWAQALDTRADRANVAILVLLAIALLVVQRRRTRGLALLSLAVAIAMVAIRGHAPQAQGWWVTPAATVHIVAGGAWIGALVHLAVNARSHAAAEGAALATVATRYSRAALVAVGLTLLTGSAVAFAQLSQISDLVGARYGRVLSVKLLLVGVGLAIALVAHRRALPATGTRVGKLAKYTAFEATVLLGVLAASALLSTTAPTAGLGQFQLPPTPLVAPITLVSDLAGSHQVLIAASLDRLQIRVLPPGGQPDEQQTATIDGIEPDGTAFDLQPRPCGPGCYDMAHLWNDGVTRFTVAVTNPNADGGTAELAVVWPPGPDATELLAQAVAVTRAAGQIIVTETVSSGPDATFGPGDIATTGDDYIASSPFSNGADNVHQLPSQAGLTIITFVVTGSGTWHQLSIDGQHRIRREILVDPGHRIDRDITY